MQFFTSFLQPVGCPILEYYLIYLCLSLLMHGLIAFAFSDVISSSYLKCLYVTFGTYNVYFNFVIRVYAYLC